MTTWLVRKVLTKRNIIWVGKCGCTRSPDCFGMPCPTHKV